MRADIVCDRQDRVCDCRHAGFGARLRPVQSGRPSVLGAFLGGLLCRVLALCVDLANVVGGEETRASAPARHRVGEGLPDRQDRRRLIAEQPAGLINRVQRRLAAPPIAAGRVRSRTGLVLH